MAQRLATFAALAALLLAPSLVAAQTNPAAGAITFVESADSNENPPFINIVECNGTTADTLTFYWNVSSFAGGGTYDIWIADVISSTTACPAATSSTQTVHSQPIVTGLAATTATQNYVDTATIQTRLTQVSVSCTAAVTQAFLCVNYNPPSAAAQVVNAASGSIKIDLGVPPTPAGVSVTPGDTVLHVKWTAGSGGTGTTTGYRVFWGPHNGTLGSSHDLTGSGTLSYDIPGLQDGTEYDVQVAALSQGKNEGTHSDIVSAIPVLVNDFWRLYKQDGGHEQGGCATGAGGLLALLALLPFAWRRRGRQP
jgi:hypothetical protein